MTFTPPPVTKRRTTPHRHKPPGYARGNEIVYLPIDSPYDRRPFWCMGVDYELKDLNELGMTLKSLNCLLEITVLLDVADEPTTDWRRAVMAKAYFGGFHYRIDLQRRICIRLDDRNPVLH